MFIASEIVSKQIGEPLEVDIPFRELSFEGVPFRTNVRLQPTTECLVHLSDPPFLVVTLSDIEIASLERVQFGLKQFRSEEHTSNSSHSGESRMPSSA